MKRNLFFFSQEFPNLCLRCCHDCSETAPSNEVARPCRLGWRKAFRSPSIITQATGISIEGPEILACFRILSLATAAVSFSGRSLSCCVRGVLAASPFCVFTSGYYTNFCWILLSRARLVSSPCLIAWGVPYAQLRCSKYMGRLRVA